MFHEHAVHCALEIRCNTSCKNCHIYSIYLQFPFPIYADFFVAKTIYALFLPVFRQVFVYVSFALYEQIFHVFAGCLLAFRQFEGCVGRILDHSGLVRELVKGRSYTMLVRSRLVLGFFGGRSGTFECCSVQEVAVRR